MSQATKMVLLEAFYSGLCLQDWQESCCSKSQFDGWEEENNLLDLNHITDPDPDFQNF